jgi:hypothetical protein
MAGDNNFPEQITATMHRQPVDELILAEEGSDASGKILSACLLRRVGGRKIGYWEVLA